MKIKKKIWYLIFVTLVFLIASSFFVVFLKKQNQTPNDSSQPQISNVANPAAAEQPQPIQSAATEFQSASATIKNISSTDRKILQTVPFVVQAPFSNWKDPNFQNACEEASMVMTMGWVKKEKTISPTEAQKRISALIDWENKTFGYSTDTNTFDMEKVFQQYFKHENVVAKENITLEEIKTEIQKGRLVIVPAFGMALKNPNFTQPGPVAHMLTIIGYDPEAKKFTTNDPGTKNGASYQYDETLLFDAIWEYPSGKTDPALPTLGKMKKAMLSISK
ncbi:MAG: C39 family peptidase [Candidatus Moraniibacteriota bacterium]